MRQGKRESERDEGRYRGKKGRGETEHLYAVFLLRILATFYNKKFLI